MVSAVRRYIEKQDEFQKTKNGSFQSQQSILTKISFKSTSFQTPFIDVREKSSILLSLKESFRLYKKLTLICDRYVNTDRFFSFFLFLSLSLTMRTRVCLYFNIMAPKNSLLIFRMNLNILKRCFGYRFLFTVSFYTQSF